MQRAGVLLACLCLCACASRYEPIVDMKGIDTNNYEADLSECRQYGEQVDVGTNAATTGLVGGAVGAAVGAAIGALSGAPGSGAALGAAGVGSTGFFGGGIKGYEKQRQVIRNCLRGRGYRVLG